jgi:hypothetical protein
VNFAKFEILCEVLPSLADRSTVGKRCYVYAFYKTKMIALKYRHFFSFKVVHSGIIFYRHSGMTTQFLICFPIYTEAKYDLLYNHALIAFSIPITKIHSNMTFNKRNLIIKIVLLTEKSHF